MKPNAWNPAQYAKFNTERRKPFDDLVKMIEKQADMQVLDLGSGTGELTQALHNALQAKSTLGIDSSSEMLKESRKWSAAGLAFHEIKIQDFFSNDTFDLIFSNATLQWVPNHQELFTRLVGLLSPRGQIAVQMPWNQDFKTHVIAREVASDPMFKEDFETLKPTATLTIEEYSEILYRLNFQQQIVKAKIYPLVANSTDQLLEWVKGSLLTYYESRLTPEKHQLFLENYKNRLEEEFGVDEPIYIPFKRILLWGRI